ncbi:hypothetical protein IAT38_006236 [Cryptococcus sp. DSM 104549]
MIPTTTAFAVLAVLGTQVVRAYDDLLFTEDFFPLINTRLDPIISPGQVSGHVHHVVGSSAFTASENFADTQKATCTTANLADDLSNYWAPQLYYKWRNGSYSAITGDGMSAYWKMPLTNMVGSGHAVVPDDFRMLAGDITRTTYDPTSALDNAVSFQCVDAEYSYDKTPFIPSDRECLTLRPQVNFPECWDGKNSYLEGNKHVSYPIDGNPEGGVCPDGFVKIPHLFLESTYHPSVANIGEGYEWYPGCFVLANGDNYGYSFHSDWLNGFPTGFIVDTFNECYNGDTISKTCAPIDSGRAKAAPRDCVTQGEVINELAGNEFAIPALPGNNPEYDSSKTSKPTNSGYTESAKAVPVSDATKGYCIQGICYDYAGSDAVVPEAGDGATVGGDAASSGVSAPASATESAAESATDSAVETGATTSAADEASATGATTTQGAAVDATESATETAVSSFSDIAAIAVPTDASSSAASSSSSSSASRHHHTRTRSATATATTAASASTTTDAEATASASILPGNALISTGDGSDDGSDEELVCERRKKKRRVAAW